MATAISLTFCTPLQQAGEEGLGSARTPFHLDRAWRQTGPADSWDCIYQPGEALSAHPPQVPVAPETPQKVRLYLGTPMRIKRDGHFVGPDDFAFRDLFGSLLRRISMLTYFHTDTPLETDFAGLAAAAHRVPRPSTEIRWQDWMRYSSRQGTTMEMGGLLGTVDLDMSGTEHFWPYLWLGQWTHAGKGTGMGLGSFGAEVIDTVAR
jgi:CRISPR-associated endoribonuclease Cas6